jgi:hypothetical protein
MGNLSNESVWYLTDCYYWCDNKYGDYSYGRTVRTNEEFYDTKLTKGVIFRITESDSTQKNLVSITDGIGIFNIYSQCTTNALEVCLTDSSHDIILGPWFIVSGHWWLAITSCLSDFMV